ncbi:MAG TPA: DUF58 domain-containing protein [Abditibacterium sp.]|jgi:uncharacterized protein (DUF58 family)
MLLLPTQLKKLDALALNARKAFTGASKGEKRSTKRGSSVEFADFRSYNAGDDIRRIDWNAYARFDKLYLKMFLEEEDLDLTLLIDASASMQFGDPPKLRAASQLAGAIGYVGLVNFDRVSASYFGETLRAQFPPARGKGAAGQLFRFLEGKEATGKADFSLVCKRAALQAKRSGLAIVISDFLFPDSYEAGLKTLAARGFETTVIQLLSREELEPSLTGDFKLVDVEDGTIKEVSVTHSLLRAYKKNLDDYTTNLRQFCLKFGMNYVLAPGDVPAEEIVSRMLRPIGVVK